jgi:hypothetical protein
MQEKVRLVYRNNKMARLSKWRRYSPNGDIIVVRGVQRNKAHDDVIITYQEFPSVLWALKLQSYKIAH